MSEPRTRRLVIETALVSAAFVLPPLLSSGLPASLPAGIGPLLPGLLLTSIPQTGLVLYLFHLQGELSRADVGLRAPGSTDAIAAALLTLLLFAFLAASQLVMTLLPPAWARGLYQGQRIRLSGWAEVPMALVFAPVAAAREELLFRCYLYIRLRDLGAGQAVALALTNAVFAASHAYQGPSAVALALVLGIMLGVAFVRTKCLWVPIAAHALYNLTLLVLTLVPLPGGVR